MLYTGFIIVLSEIKGKSMSMDEENVVQDLKLSKFTILNMYK